MVEFTLIAMTNITCKWSLFCKIEELILLKMWWRFVLKIYQVLCINIFMCYNIKDVNVSVLLISINCSTDQQEISHSYENKSV